MSDFGNTSSTSDTPYYVAKGMMKVSGSPCGIQAVVGPGYAVAVTLANRQGGGLLHIPYEENELEKPDPLAGSRTAALLSKYRNSLEKLESGFKGAVADIIGGADILRLLPTAKRDRIVAARVNPLVGELTRWGIAKVRLEVGGEKGRKVFFEPVAGKLEVTVTGAARKSGMPTGRAVDQSRTLISCSELTVNMGCLQVAGDPVRLQAILGSCVGIALYDKQKKIGGLVHVMMPLFPGNGEPKSKYADTAVPELIEKMLEAGAERNRLKAKLAGGANVLFQGTEGRFAHISGQNVVIARDALIAAGVEIIQEHVGGRVGRKMIVDLSNFEMSIKMLTGARGVE